MNLAAEALTDFHHSLRSLSPFTDEELQLMVAGMQLVELDKRTTFVRADERSRSVGYVLSGAVRYYYLKDGVETTSYFCLPGDWVGAYTSFLRQEPSKVYIESLEPTRLLTFSFDQLRRWEASPTFAYRINHFSRRLAEYLIGCYDDRVASFILQSPEERYLQLLDKQPGVLQLIPQQYLANFLGVTPVSLSRIRRRILERG